MENTNTVTVKEIFDQIVALQKELTGELTLYNMRDALKAVFGEGAGAEALGSEDFESAVSKVCEPYTTREVTFLRMIGLYEKMYNDCKNGVQ